MGTARALADLSNITVAGYYPTPPEIIPSIPALLRPVGAEPAEHDALDGNAPESDDDDRFDDPPVWSILHPRAGDGAAVLYEVLTEGRKP
jgi:hypothetical protein